VNPANVSLPAGSRLGSHEIRALIGAGGMGEVYRATDTKLGRDVAIKVLPAEVAGNAERLARFEREAKLLALLNHPNIAHVYGFERATLPDGSTAHFLAMELVEGEDLAERLARGPIPLDEALEIAKQIAEALEEAHEKGIVHRDLKPANVKVTPDGKVKVLDFGLAKAYTGEGQSGSSADLSQSPTMAHTATQAGVILGTAGYMSPEQARGKPVDKRSDIWAFGVVLYEMLTGRQLFSGETASDTLAGVLRAEIDWARLPGSTPRSIVRLLQRCLNRDHRRRLADASDARLEIEEAGLEEAQGGRGGPPASRPSWVMVAAMAAVALASGALIAWIAFRRVTDPGRELVRLEISGASFQGTSPAGISPNGRRLAYVPYHSTNRERLHVRELGDFTSRIMEGTESASSPFFSPDGENIGYFSDVGKGLFVVNLASGSTQKIAGSPVDHESATWTADGRIVSSGLEIDGARWAGLAIVPANGGVPKPLTTPAAGERAHADPIVIPGGRWVLFGVVGPGGFNVDAVSLEDGGRHRVAEHVSTPQYSATGHLLFYRPSDLSLLASRFDADKAVLEGETVVLQAGVRRLGNGHGGYALSASGTLIYTTDAGDSSLTGAYSLVWVDRHGAVAPLVERRDTWAQPRLSPDGRTLVVRQTATPDCSLWTIDLSRGILSRLTFTGDHHSPEWTAAGTGILSSVMVGSVRQIVEKALDAEAPERQLTRSRDNLGQAVESPDGRVIVFQAQTAENGSDLYTIGSDGKGEAQPFTATPFDEEAPCFSPDGRWVAYVSNESGRSEIYIRPFPGPGVKVRVSSQGGAGPRWSRDGKELFYTSQERLMVVGIREAPEPRVSAPQELFGGQFVWERPGNFDVSADGKRFVMVQRTADDRMTEHLRVVLDFARELETRLPH